MELTGAYRQYVLFFEQVLDIEPLNTYALVGLGDVARKRARFRQAIDYYKTCLEGHPDNITASLLGGCTVITSKDLMAIPYALWSNRSDTSKMAVWLERGD